MPNLEQTKDTRVLLGRQVENWVASGLQNKGWVLIHQNWRPKPGMGQGQVDILALDPRGDPWVLEVKALQSKVFGEIPPVHPKQIQRLKRSALHWSFELGRSVNLGLILVFRKDQKVEFIKNPW